MYSCLVLGTPPALASKPEFFFLNPGLVNELNCMKRSNQLRTKDVSKEGAPTVLVVLHWSTNFFFLGGGEGNYTSDFPI